MQLQPIKEPAKGRGVSGEFTQTFVGVPKIAKMLAEVRDINTRLHACSIEKLWKEGVFACGTYELNEAEAARHGEIVVMTDGISGAATVCESGVLDMKYAFGRLCVALSHGGLCIYVVDADAAEPLVLEAAVSLESEGLFLSVDIEGRLLESCWYNSAKIAVSTQSGSVLIYKYDVSCTPCTLSLTHRAASVHTMMREAMPAWIVFFDPHLSSRVVSGGDDCVMKVWEVPAVDAEQSEPVDPSEAVALNLFSQNRGIHTAGVTSGQWHPHLVHIFATGSYDEHVRVWDDRDLTKPLLDLSTGGGVWRVKWCCPSGSGTVTYLVLACMHGGCRIHRLAFTVVDGSLAGEGEGDRSSNRRCSVAVVGEVRHQDVRNPQHLAYGIDVLRVTPVGNLGESTEHSGDERYELQLASCSFYDNLVQIWSCIL